MSLPEEDHFCAGSVVTTSAFVPLAAVDEIPNDNAASVDGLYCDSHCGDVGLIYRRGVQLYRRAGWRGVLPLPPGAKSPPPKGFTGYDGQWPTDAQINEWVDVRPPGSNLGLRLEHGVIGVDVDAYGAKTGGKTIAEAERRWGPLPATYRSSARADDQVSGIRLYRIPEGTLLKGVIRFADQGIGDIEIAQPHHRLVVAWPSIHPKVGQPYRWYGPDGQLMAETMVPRVRDLPELPQAWVDALCREAVREETFDGSAPNRTAAMRDRIDEERYAQLLSLNGDHEPDRVVAQRLDTAITALSNGAGSRYDTTRDHVAALMRLHAAGRAGVPAALRQLQSVYILEVGDTRPYPVAGAEFHRFTEGAAALVAASLPSLKTGIAAPDNPEGPERHAGLIDGAAFVLDVPDTTPALWGQGADVLWAEGESLMIAGPMGVGKTTLAGLLIRALLCPLPMPVLGLPVTQRPGRILYLAMDRPAQIARSLHRQFVATQRDTLAQRLLIRRGPPPADFARHPETLVDIALRAGAGTVFLDSLKDAAIGLAEDAVGAGYNRARQLLLAEGIELCELHHVVKKSSAAPTASDVYGSAWISSGTGSIIMLSGQPGDPIVGFNHIRQPAEEVGPFRLLHNAESGELDVHHAVDLVELAKATSEGITAKDAATVLFESNKPAQAEIEKARRKLMKLTASGALRHQDGIRGGAAGGEAARWFPA